MALREGNWKFVPFARPNGFRTANGAANPPRPELYNLSDDMSESKNLAPDEADRVKQMRTELQRERQAGRTRPKGQKGS